MTIDHSQNDSLSLPGFQIFKPSHRTRPEQIVGLGIIILISLAFEVLNGTLIRTSFESDWYKGLIQAPWAIAEKAYSPVWTIYFLILGIAFWTLWRRNSLRVLKLELSVYATQFLFQLAWSLNFFILHETLFALAALLILWCNHLLSALLFWKREHLSGLLLLAPFLWIFYVMGLNMVICISNP